jgi:hypothetical protein
VARPHVMPQQRQQDMFRPQVSPMPPQDFSQSQLGAQDAAMRSLGMPTSNEVDYTDPRRGMGINIAQPPRQQPQAQTNQPPATPANLANVYQDFLRGMGGTGGGSQSVLGQPGGNLVGGGQQQSMMQQVRPEDPRMQAMRMMQQMGGRF